MALFAVLTKRRIPPPGTCQVLFVIYLASDLGSQFPMDYHNTIKWYQYDPMKWFIWSMQNIGLASHVKVFLENEVRQGQLTMQLKHLRETQESLTWPSNSDDLPVVSFDSLADVRPLNAAHNLLAMKHIGVLHGRHPHILDIAKRVPPCQQLKITRYNKLSSNYARSPSIHAHPASILPSFLTFTMASQDLAATYHTSFNIPGADAILSSLDGILYRLSSSVFRRSTKFFASNSFTFDNKPIPIYEHDVVEERLLWILSDLAISLWRTFDVLKGVHTLAQMGNGRKVIGGWAVFVGDRRVVFVSFDVNHLEVCSMAPGCGVDIMDTMHHLPARGIEWEYGMEEFMITTPVLNTYSSFSEVDGQQQAIPLSMPFAHGTCDENHFDVSSASPGDGVDIFLLEDDASASGEQVFLSCVGSMCVCGGKRAADSEKEDFECPITLRARLSQVAFDKDVEVYYPVTTSMPNSLCNGLKRPAGDSDATSMEFVIL
ncbi:uncharacterized protein ARMOST_02181 [Armillaria ostoyae]|uniref:Uncharacterized protein n=1 Tax=Armillaria ostoyae TaxID=47428 RepID=A0A284QR16_ARMOS|nr:uncharacterized protein ARMOST_02181 [Armillaria ostoyae]